MEGTSNMVKTYTIIPDYDVVNTMDLKILYAILSNNRKDLHHLMCKAGTNTLNFDVDRLIAVEDEKKELNGLYTPLYIAYAYEKYDIVDDLLRYGANPDIRSIENNEWGATAKEKFQQLWDL